MVWRATKMHVIPNRRLYRHEEHPTSSVCLCSPPKVVSDPPLSEGKCFPSQQTFSYLRKYAFSSLVSSCALNANCEKGFLKCVRDRRC